MIVHGMQRSGCGRRHPGTTGARRRVRDLRLHHSSHHVRHRPHAFAYLRLATQATGQSHVYIPVFVCSDPGLGFHIPLRHHRTGFHTGVNLITGAIQKPGIDENDALLRLSNTLC